MGSEGEDEELSKGIRIEQDEDDDEGEIKKTSGKMDYASCVY